jgi:RimJ/RimL family protein N-acetyltransferase
MEPMKPAFETERLSLRPFALTDVDVAFGWFGDPEVMHFTTNGPDDIPDQTRERLIRYIEHQGRHGFSKWLIEERISGTAIGDAGLLVLKELGPIPDLGFRFRKTSWRKGYATEVALAWAYYAFDELGLDCLRAFAHVDNVASLQVLEKVGFRRQGRERVMGMDSYTYMLVPSWVTLARRERAG